HDRVLWTSACFQENFVMTLVRLSSEVEARKVSAPRKSTQALSRIALRAPAVSGSSPLSHPANLTRSSGAKDCQRSEASIQFATTSCIALVGTCRAVKLFSSRCSEE